MLYQNDRVDLHDAAKTMIDRCPRLPEILEEINHNTSLHKKQILQNDRTEIFASDYKALADLLSTAMANGTRNTKLILCSAKHSAKR
jgi:PBP1b-binding outer membrane lipoprotein LpoB